MRNTKVVNIIRELEEFCIEVLVHDPLADSEEAKAIYDLNLLSLEEMRELDALILAVPHNAYSSLSLEAMRSWFRDPRNGLLLDIKGFFEPDQIKAAGLNYWRL